MMHLAIDHNNMFSFPSSAELTIDETSLTVDSLMRTDETLKIVPTFEVSN